MTENGHRGGQPLSLFSFHCSAIENAKILDVGCGAGGWLLAMHDRGYLDLTGQDIDNSCSKRLKRNNIQFYDGLLEECRLPEHAFDVIRMEHVLEHVPYPTQTLLLIRRLLKPDGLLVMGVPNIDSLSSAYGGLRWHALELPRHLYHFTPQTVRELAYKSGFSVIRVQHVPVWHQMAQSMAARSCHVTLRRLLLHPASQVVSPLWGAVTRSLQRADFIAAVMKPANPF